MCPGHAWFMNGSFLGTTEWYKKDFVLNIKVKVKKWQQWTGYENIIVCKEIWVKS